ncbi:MAG TPA: glycosyltransferase 87 family protein [Thermoanaerobaculia bacterium]|nr:glycosyltransferase 87 family protein [Thermoanaerobaculia bacterium]
MLVRLALVATTFGTNDAIFWTQWLSVVKRFGIGGAYEQSAMVNHPPLALVLIVVVDMIAQATHLAFTDVFRLFQVAADGVCAAALYRIGGPRLALFVLLSPGAAFVSAFHCNSDPAMIALVVVAAALAMSGRPFLAGIALALAGGIKVVPFLFVPLFVLAQAREARTRFLLGFGSTAAAVFLPALMAGGLVVVKHIFGYAGGLPHEWGVPGLAFAISRNFPALREIGQDVMRAYVGYGRFVVYLAIAAVIVMAARQRRFSILHAVAVMVLALFAFAPGFGVQYIAWLFPLLPFALPWRGAIAVNIAGSLFLFVTYTIWSGGFPWWFADLARPGPFRFLAAVAGYAMWAVVCFALVAAVRRFRSSPPPETAG